MAAQQFAEVLGNPYDVWVAPVGTVVPTTDAAPTGGWTKFGTNGSLNQGSAGVTIGITEAVSNFKPSGGTRIVKDWRTQEDLTVAFSLVDTTVEQLSAILDAVAITTVAASTAVAGSKKIQLIRGVKVAYFAILVRGLSPYDDGTGLTAQWAFSRCCQSANQSIVYVPGTPAEVACQFDSRGVTAGSDSSYEAQTAAIL
jgi:hypothetical protein